MPSMDEVATPVDVDNPEDIMGNPEPCKRCKGPCTCTKMLLKEHHTASETDESEHNSPIHEGKESQKKEECCMLKEHHTASETDESEHNSPIREGKESQKKEECCMLKEHHTASETDESDHNSPIREGKESQKREKCCMLKEHLTASETDESKHNSPIRENEENQKKELCMADKPQMVETEKLQKAEACTPQRCEIYRTESDDTETGRPVVERVETLEKEKESCEDDTLTVQGPGGVATGLRNDDGEDCRVIQKTILTEQKGQISAEDFSKIQTNLPFLVKELDPDGLIDILFSKRVLSLDDCAELNDIPESNRQNRIRKMLFKILKSEPGAYRTFLKCLEQEGYWQAIKRLEPDSVKYKSHIKYPGQKYIELKEPSSPLHEEFIKDVEDNIEGLYPESTELVAVKQLTKGHKGCVQVTFSLISLNSNKSESELRQMLETSVKSGLIGGEQVSSDGFSFEKVTEDGAEECKVIKTIPLIDSQERMVDEDWSKIRNNLEFLKEELKVEVLIDTLFSKHLLNEDDVEELDAESSGNKGVRKMLFKIRRKGRDAYKTLLKCLESKGYWQAIKQLEPDSVRYQGQVKYSGDRIIDLVDPSSPFYKEFIDEVEGSIEDLLDNSTQFVVVKKLSAGCVQVTFSLVSLDSNKTESELRQVLETAVNSGFIGRKRVSSKGFSFEKVEEGDEPISTGEEQDQFRNLKRKLKDAEEENSNLRKQVSELVDEGKKAKISQEQIENGDEPISTTEQQDIQNQFTNLKRKLKDMEVDNSNLGKHVKELEDECKKLKTHLKAVESGLPYFETTTLKDEFPLHHAALYTVDKEEFESVLDKHAGTIRQLDKDGDTPFDKACQSQYCPLDKVKLIVYKGYRDAETLVQICQTAPKSLLSLICCIPMKDKWDKSVISAMTELRKQLMDGGDIDARTHSDKTLLHFASEYCDIEAMTFLIDHDSDVRSIDTDGASPMVYSCKSDDDPVQKINLLEAHGAIIERNPIYNKTLLHTACEFSTIATVTFLTEQEGLDVNGLDSYGKSPLYYSCKSDKKPIEKIEFLISRGASLKCSAIDNYTLLHAACDFNTVEVVEHLIELGLDVESEDIYRYTPLHCCCRSRIDPIEKIKKLADHGARFLIKFRREYIGIASKFDLTETVDFLKRSLPENVVPEVSNEGEVAMDVPVHAEQT